MKVNLKKLLSMLLVVGSIVAVVMIAFSNSELENAWDALGSLNPIWVLGIFSCWFIYMFSDAFAYWMYFRSEGFKISIGRCVNASLIGFYYSNITPTSAGGQPMLVNSFRKAGIPVGYGTMGATVRFICNQFAISFLSLLCFLIDRDFVYEQLGGVIWLIRIGWLINFAGVPLVLMAAFQRRLIQRIAEWIIDLGVRIKLVKNRETAVSSVTNVLDTYHVALKELLERPWRIIIQMLSGMAGITALIASIYFVYHAFGYSECPWIHLFTISFMLYISACYTPLPGASGAQEGGFLLYFQNIFPPDTIGLALLVWRFFTYYMFIIVGVFMVILERIILRKERKKKERQSKISNNLYNNLSDNFSDNLSDDLSKTLSENHSETKI